MKNLWNVKMDVKSMVWLSMFMALTVVLGYLNKFLPEMPQGGTISFDIIAIFLCAYFMGAGYGILCGIGVALLQFVLGMASFYGPWSVLLDYVLPLAVCGLAPLVPTVEVKKVPIFLGVCLSMVLKYISHFLSGAFLFASYAPKGMSPIIYSLGYNFYYNAATLIVCMVIVPILYKRLKPVFHQ